MFETLFGSGVPLTARFFIAFAVVLGLIGLAAWLVRRFGAHRLGAAGARGRQPRLAVVDATVIDTRRRLVLIRRDNIEHLLMIGGPTDVLIEPNIVRASPARDTAAHATPTHALVADNSWPLQPFHEPAAMQRNYSRSEAGRSLTGQNAQPANNQKPVASNDHNLSEVALQLEASIRRKPGNDARPSAKLGDPGMRMAARDVEPELSASAKSNPSGEPVFEPRFDIETEVKPGSKNFNGSSNHIASGPVASDFVAPGPIASGPAASNFVAPARAASDRDVSDRNANGRSSFGSAVNVEAAFDVKPASANKHYYDSLEEEMASLLGRSKKS